MGTPRACTLLATKQPIFQFSVNWGLNGALTLSLAAFISTLNVNVGWLLTGLSVGRFVKLCGIFKNRGHLSSERVKKQSDCCF